MKKSWNPIYHLKSSIWVIHPVLHPPPVFPPSLQWLSVKNSMKESAISVPLNWIPGYTIKLAFTEYTLSHSQFYSLQSHPPPPPFRPVRFASVAGVWIQQQDTNLHFSAVLTACVSPAKEQRCAWSLIAIQVYVTTEPHIYWTLSSKGVNLNNNVIYLPRTRKAHPHPLRSNSHGKREAVKVAKLNPQTAASRYYYMA